MTQPDPNRSGCHIHFCTLGPTQKTSGRVGEAETLPMHPPGEGSFPKSPKGTLVATLPVGLVSFHVPNWVSSGSQLCLLPKALAPCSRASLEELGFFLPLSVLVPSKGLHGH